MTGYLININNDCNECMECVEVCQSGILTEDFINMAKNKINCRDNRSMYIKLTNLESYGKNSFRKYFRGGTYCESCEDICEQHAIWIVNPEWVEL